MAIVPLRCVYEGLPWSRRGSRSYTPRQAAACELAVSGSVPPSQIVLAEHDTLCTSEDIVRSSSRVDRCPGSLEDQPSGTLATRLKYASMELRRCNPGTKVRSSRLHRASLVTGFTGENGQVFQN
jgi:hypothetical protein